MVHRDLKPANVLLGPDVPLLGDFGIAHELDSTHITGTGLVTCTAAYLAPEQILGELAGPAADVYALGLILLECLTVQREFPGTLAESAMARLRRAPRVPAGLPEPLAHTLSRMTAREPTDRPTAEQVPVLLRRSSAEVTPVGTSTPRRQALALAGGMVTAAAAAVLAVVLTTPDAAENPSARLPAVPPPVSSTSAPAGVAARIASGVVAATSPIAEPVTPSLAAASSPDHGTAGPDGTASGKGSGKVKGKDNGKAKGKNRNEP